MGGPFKENTGSRCSGGSGDSIAKKRDLENKYARSNESHNKRRKIKMLQQETRKSHVLSVLLAKDRV